MSVSFAFEASGVHGGSIAHIACSIPNFYLSKGAKLVSISRHLEIDGDGTHKSQLLTSKHAAVRDVEAHNTSSILSFILL